MVKKVLLFLAAVCMAHATTYYVATTGSDSNPGTAASPFATIQKGVDSAIAGDTIIVNNGTYSAPSICSSFPQQGYFVQITNAGTSSAPITLKAASHLGAVLDGGQLCHSLIEFEGSAAYWIIQDFDLTNSYWSGFWMNSSGTHNITIQRNHVHGLTRTDSTSNGITGIYTGPGVSYITFDRNEVNHIGRTGGTNIGNHDHGMYIHGSNWTITNNLIYDCFAGWGIQTADGISNVLIANNTFAFHSTVRDGQILLWDTNTNVTVRNNIFDQPGAVAIESLPDVGTTFTNVVIDNNLTSTTSMYDNVVTSGVTITNSILNTAPGVTNDTVAPYDFHLLAGATQSIDKGVAVSAVTTDFDGNARPNGTAYDLGAFEFQQTVAPPPAGGHCVAGLFWDMNCKPPRKQFPVSTVSSLR